MEKKNISMMEKLREKEERIESLLEQILEMRRQQSEEMSDLFDRVAFLEDTSEDKVPMGRGTVEESVTENFKKEEVAERDQPAIIPEPFVPKRSYKEVLMMSPTSVLWANPLGFKSASPSTRTRTTPLRKRCCCLL